MVSLGSTPGEGRAPEAVEPLPRGVAPGGVGVLVDDAPVLRARLADPTRVSDADERIYDDKKAAYEPPDEWPAEDRIRVDTDDPEWRDRLRAELLRRLP